ncbi:von Willebrand factor type A domain-containing protein [Xylaria digitata]|nr:von Willebrand factor type A domain-containing protein [Xylaria digitata]
MSVFSAGIVWDSREPLPRDYTEAAPVTALPAISGLTAHTVRTPQDPFRYQGVNQAQAPKIFPKVVKELDRNVLPAVSVSVEARIIGDVAEVVAKQLFWNDADTPIHRGSYTFALPNGCTVTGFTCRIGNNKVLKATAQPKGEAQEAFQRAVAAHTTAALLDQNTPEIFTSTLASIPPNTRIKTEITYATVLKRGFGVDSNTTTLTIPTYIANRYGERPAGLEELNLNTKLDDMSLRIEILESEHIRSIKSASHEILVERGLKTGQALKWDRIGKEPEDTRKETAIVTMKEAVSWIETDFVLSIETACSKANGGSEAWLEIHPFFENQAAMMVTLPPRLLISQNEISKDGEILFMADRSGSMEDKMENLRSAMKYFLKGIPMGRTFNVFCFGSTYESLWTKSQLYGQESLQAALDYVSTKFHADMGGTEILPALEAILAARDPSLPCDVVILTDGEVWRLDEMLGLVRRANESSNGSIRFFSLGLGAHVSHALIEGIAKKGGGYSEVIPRADKDDWEERLVAMLRAALTSHTRTLSLELGGLKATTSPENLESLNLFQAHRIFLLLDHGVIPDKDSVALALVSDGNRTFINLSITRAEKPATLIHSLSARAILDDFERGIAPNSPCRPGDSSDGKELDISRLAETIACKYSLPSKWTSLLLLGKEDRIPEGGVTSGVTNKIVISRARDGNLLHPRGIPSFTPSESYALSQSYTPSPWWGDSIRRECQSSVNRPRVRASRSDPDGSSGVKGKTEYPPLPHSNATYSPDDAELPYPIFSSKIAVPVDSLQSAALGLSAEKEFISFILRHQAFNGSIASGALNGLSESIRDLVATLKNWLCKKTQLEGQVLDLVASTALIVEILERDYKDYEGLWVMIREKALGYVHLQLFQSNNLQNELMELSRENLEQLGERAFLKRGAASSSSAGENRKSRFYDIAEDEDQADSNRALVHRAPLE